jgi:hypothetical protein
MAIRYWETMFDPRFMWDNEWKQRRDIEDASEQIQAQAESAAQRDARLQQQIHDLSVTVMALVELLADAKQLDPQELRARVQAAVIGEQHGRKAEDTSQNAWDGLKK